MDSIVSILPRFMFEYLGSKLIDGWIDGWIDTSPPQKEKEKGLWDEKDRKGLGTLINFRRLLVSYFLTFQSGNNPSPLPSPPLIPLPPLLQIPHPHPYLYPYPYPLPSDHLFPYIHSISWSSCCSNSSCCSSLIATFIASPPPPTPDADAPEGSGSSSGGMVAGKERCFQSSICVC